MLGYGKKTTKQEALTSWRQPREVRVRTRKNSDREMDTHVLESAEEGTSQDTEINRPSGGHSLPGDSRGRKFSGHGK